MRAQSTSLQSRDGIGHVAPRNRPFDSVPRTSLGTSLRTFPTRMDGRPEPPGRSRRRTGVGRQYQRFRSGHTRRRHRARVPQGSDGIHRQEPRAPPGSTAVVATAAASGMSLRKTGRPRSPRGPRARQRASADNTNGFAPDMPDAATARGSREEAAVSSPRLLASREAAVEMNIDRSLTAPPIHPTLTSWTCMFRQTSKLS